MILWGYSELLTQFTMSYPEAVFHLLSLPLLWKSRDVVYLSTDYPENRIRMLKHNVKAEDEQIFHDGIIEYYQNRPIKDLFEKMSLIEFASWYVRKTVQADIANIDEQDETGKQVGVTQIKLLNGKGHMTKKFKKNIIRLPKLTCGDNIEDSERYFFSKLMTYVPWRADYLLDLKADFKTYKECFMHHAKAIEPLIQEYEKGSDAISEAFLQINEREPDLEKNIADLQQSLEEVDAEIDSCFPYEDEAENFEDDDQCNAHSLPTPSQFEETLEKNRIYYQEIRELNTEQLKIFWHVLDWVRKKKINTEHPPIYLGIIGGAGTGKTKIINVLYNLFLRELPEADPDTACMKISFTGMASANIDGRTWHSFLGLGRGHGKIDGLKDMKAVSKATTRDRLQSVEVIIEDEISLESSQMDNYMNDLLNHVFEVPSHERGNTLYNNLSVIKVGDFMQLNLFGTPIYENVSTADDPYSKFRTNRWKDNFKCFELTKSMRQKDEQFANILKTARFMSVKPRDNLELLPHEQKEVISFLRSREIQQSHPNYPHFALHLFPTNADVNVHNENMIASVIEKVQIQAEDSKMDETGSFSICKVQNVKDDQGLPHMLTIGVGARAMITKNENVEDKIVNGTIGTIIAMTRKIDGCISTIWLKPDDKNTGVLKRKSLPSNIYKKYPHAIPIKKVECNISVAKNSTYKRKQFPLKLCYAATIHKYQGRSLDEVVIGGFNSRGWMPGMFYTALTRCRTAVGLHLLGFKPTALISNHKGQQEIERIRHESLITCLHPRLLFFEKFPKDKWEFISLQNVRSLSLHLEDVLSDPIMMASSIVCLTETSVKDRNWPGWSKFSDFHVFQTCRKEVSQFNNIEERKSGGVALLLKKKNLSNSNESLIDKRLEMTSVETNFCADKGKNSVISLIYKDHKMPKCDFLARIKTVFSSHREENAVILGDFNINMREDHSLTNVAESMGFMPIVNCSTTINDSLLDQIFINSIPLLNSVKAITLQSYFSDHDLVVLCIPK